MGTAGDTAHREPWNQGKIVGQKAPFKVKEIWALRVRLQIEDRVRELALFNLGIDSKLRGCDLVALRVRDKRRAAGDRAGPDLPGLGCSTAAQGPGERAATRRRRLRRPSPSRSPASRTSASSLATTALSRPGLKPQHGLAEGV
jgi:hypothetical protein